MHIYIYIYVYTYVCVYTYDYLFSRAPAASDAARFAGTASEDPRRRSRLTRSEPWGSALFPPGMHKTPCTPLHKSDHATAANSSTLARMHKFQNPLSRGSGSSFLSVGSALLGKKSLLRSNPPIS